MVWWHLSIRKVITTNKVASIADAYISMNSQQVYLVLRSDTSVLVRCTVVWLVWTPMWRYIDGPLAPDDSFLLLHITCQLDDDDDDPRPAMTELTE